MYQAPVENLSKLTTQYTQNNYVNKIIETILTFWHLSFQNTKPLRCYTGMFWTPSNKDLFRLQPIYKDMSKQWVQVQFTTIKYIQKCVFVVIYNTI